MSEKLKSGIAVGAGLAWTKKKLPDLLAGYLDGQNSAMDYLTLTSDHQHTMNISAWRVLITTDTTYYFNSRVAYTGGTPKISGCIKAVRGPNAGGI